MQRFHILKAAIITFAVFWIVMLCSMADVSEDPTASVITTRSGVMAAAEPSVRSVRFYQLRGVTANSTLHTVSDLHTKAARSKH